MATTREDHLNWSKKRALEYLERGDITQAWTSMCSDLTKHEELEDHIAIKLGGMLLASGDLNTVEKMKEFIEGFE